MRITPRLVVQSRKWSYRVLVAVLSLVFLIPFPYLYSINNPNENTRVYLVMALVDYNTWELDNVVSTFGWTNDMAKVPDQSKPSGSHLAAVKGPATAYLGVPIYYLHKKISALFGKTVPDSSSPQEQRIEWLRQTTITLQLFCAHLPCLVFLIWFERRLRLWSKDPILRWCTVFAMGLGTNYLAYSFVFVSHALIAAVVFIVIDRMIAVAKKLSIGASATGDLFLTGLCTGLITLLEYHTLFVSAVFAIGTALMVRKSLSIDFTSNGQKSQASRFFYLSLAWGAGVAIPVLLLMLFQWGSFGSPFTPGHKMMQTQEFKALSEKGFFTISTPDPAVIKALLFDRTFGLFSLSPFFILSIPACFMALKGWVKIPKNTNDWQRWVLIIATIAFVVLVVSTASSAIWRGGWTVGPRYLGAAPGLLAPVVLWGLSRFSKDNGRKNLAHLLALSTMMAGVIQIGLVGLFISTLPESISRPLIQIVKPMLSLGFTPHVAFELAPGVELITAGSLWYVAPGAILLGVGVIVLAILARDRKESWWVLLGATCLLIILTVESFRLPADVADHGPEVRSLFAQAWEPKNRDKISLAKKRAEGDPCVWYEVANLEKELGRIKESANAEKNARQKGCVR